QPSLQLDAGATGNVQYEWFDNLGNTLSQMPELTVNGAGLYFLLATDPDNGCSAQDSILISEDLLPPVADAGVDQVLDCGASSVTLDGSGSSSGPDLEYEWTNGNGIALGTDPTLEVDAADEYILTLTDLGNGCTAGDTTVVQLDANAPVADAGPNAQLTCSVFEVTLDGSGSSSGPDIQLSWQDPNGQPIGQTSVVDVDLPGIYSLTVTNTANNCSSISTVAVTIDTLSPMADAGPNLTLNCQ
ncbi:MAG: PKD domain-containing protein, partial [Saprospiraceae bacterium]|nr:PKD domain-containing protein [Saprospiraceae bacterium]